ncbi:MAG: hypothetical protein LC539_16960 [Candidatus Thiodiazotropha sp.]|nr:hypothetical protein [Candidatus Thiodiazotropha sp.]
MTIIKNGSAITYHQRVKLDEAVCDALIERMSHVYGHGILQQFECFCDITGKSYNYLQLSSKCFKRTAIGFMGGLLSGEFNDSSPSSNGVSFRKFLSAVSEFIGDVPELLEPSISKRREFAYPVYKELTQEISTEIVEYWQGWKVVSRKGESSYLRLARLWHTHGAEFARTIHKALALFVDKQARPTSTEFSKMFEYLADNEDKWPPETFSNPLAINEFFKDFMRDYFLNSNAYGLNINTQIKAYRKLISHVEEALIAPGYWAKPFLGTIPRPKSKKINGATTNIKKSSDGVEIKSNLITDIPLIISDEEAFQLLFTQIKKDISIVENWATDEVDDMWERYLNRNNLALSGVPYKGGAGIKSIDEIGLNNICATFEHDGFVNDRRYLDKTFGSHNKRTEIAHLLALPVSKSLWPHQCLLTIVHPIITGSFLKGLKLYNKRGQRTGFVKTDTGYLLIGYKDRRGKSKAEQKIELTERATRIVKQVITLTEPLRDFLKKNHDDSWRELFLSCGTAFFTPQGVRQPFSVNASDILDDTYFSRRALESFERKTGLHGASLNCYVQRLSISSVRKSCGVHVYLDTWSVEKMAKALGHAKYNTDLLSHYLPESILAFFQTRWIRIFQKAIICEAMKDSPCILEAAKFSSMEELHEFLSNHALKDIPSSVSDPENELTDTSNADDSEVYISVDTGILTALISLECAVERSVNSNINSYARYWYKLSRLICKEIERCHDYHLRECLESAKKHANPSTLMELIYDTSA